MKTLTLETSKKLQPYLKDMETEYMYKHYSNAMGGSKDGYFLEKTGRKKVWVSDIKTLTLEEAWGILPNEIDGFILHLSKTKGQEMFYTKPIGEEKDIHIIGYMKLKNGEPAYLGFPEYGDFGDVMFENKAEFGEETPLIAIEKMINYLIDNKLLGTKEP